MPSGRSEKPPLATGLRTDAEGARAACIAAQNKKMGRSRKKTGETKPKISGEKIECAQLDVNSAGFGAKPRQAADWETGAAQARRRTKMREK